jgi:hypothetical protein
MTVEALNVLPGRIHDLFPEQEVALKEMWAQVLTVLEGHPFHLVNEVAEPDATLEGGAAQEQLAASLNRTFVKPRIRFVSNKTVFRDALGDCSEEDVKNFKSTLRLMFRQDHPDNFMLRFLRARKYDVTKALESLAFTLRWRQEEFKADELLLKGELEVARTQDKGLLLQFEIGKAFIYGIDRKDRPLVVVKPELHDPKTQSDYDMERYVVLIIEAVRGFMKEPMVDTAAVVFDFTNFTLANLDYAVLKFIFKCLEAHYPECLGFLFIHRAPWIFNGVWNIIKHWIDPVVAAKISFTKTYEDLAEFIEPKYILKDLGGESDFSYEYVVPAANENDRTKDFAKKKELLNERDQILDAFLENTVIWIKSTEHVAREAQAQKDSWADRLRNRYWVLDPYVRGRNIFDRNGALAQFQPDYVL